MQSSIWNIAPHNMEKVVKLTRQTIEKMRLYHVTITRSLGGSESFDWDPANGLLSLIQLSKLDEDAMGIIFPRSSQLPVTRKIVFREEYSGHAVFDGESIEIRFTMNMSEDSNDHVVVTFSRS